LFVLRPRQYYKEYATATFVWDISNISQFKEEKQRESQRFFVGGYCFYLQAEYVSCEPENGEKNVNSYKITSFVLNEM
jgi:hypothetical protein